MQENSLVRAPAHRPVVVQVHGEPQGVLVPKDGGFRFLAVKLPAFAVDGMVFESLAQAEVAVARAIGSPPV